MTTQIMLCNQQNILIPIEKLILRMFGLYVALHFCPQQWL